MMTDVTDRANHPAHLERLWRFVDREQVLVLQHETGGRDFGPSVERQGKTPERGRRIGHRGNHQFLI